MKPKTKNEIWALREQAQLPELPQRTLDWAKRTLMRHDGYTWFAGAYSKKRRVVWCQNCGRAEYLPVDEKINESAYTCRECESVLVLVNIGPVHPKVQTCSHEFVVARVHKGWQVFEGVELERTVRLGERPEYALARRYAIWINSKGKEVITTTAYSRSYYSFWWRPEAGWTIGRHNGTASGYCVYEDTFDLSGMKTAPGGRYLPELRRRGWRPGMKEISSLSIENVCSTLLRSSVAETLLKAGQYALFEALVSEGKGNRVEKFWPSVKIALRHGMKKYETIGDIGLWLDYLQGLEQEHRDMRSPKWLLPEDLNRAHQAQIARTRAAYDRKRRLAQLEEDRRFDEELKKRIGIVAGFVLTDGDIEISPLKTVNDFYCEGSALHHCVFTMSYYKRKDSLILGAKVNGERTETIEVSLKDFSVSQCRGKNNMDSPYHKRIMSLMSSNLGRLRDVYRRAGAT
ncbi:putative uncharacterized protein [Bacteroides sp. CAG:709]|nr:putative uncharacterized protein [Bacteroides sp. CAG:709]